MSVKAWSGPLNLSNQEQKCHSYCETKGHPVIRVFIDPGESARTADRPEFQQMLAYCKTHRREVGYVVVQDLSRFARNNGDQAQFIAELGNLGVKLCSVYEPNVDDTAAGKLAANIHGTFNQFFSDQLAERMKDRSRASALGGRYPWPAPISYLNDSRERTGANLIPDPERAPLVREAFRLIATGNYAKAEVLKIVTAAGLRTRKGNELSAQTFHLMLTKTVYCGYTTASFLDTPVKALHEPLVSESLFREVQDVLRGRRRSVAPKTKRNPNFPLNCFVRCGSCKTPITGGLVTGKNKSRRIGYYWCRKAGCRSVMVRKEHLETTFVAHLRRLRPDEQTISEFLKVAEQVWTRRQGDAEATAKTLGARLAEQKRLKSELLRAKLPGEVSQYDYTQANSEFDKEIEAIQGRLQSEQSGGATLAAFLRFADAMMLDVAGAWRGAKPDQRIRLQNLLFQNGLPYSEQFSDFGDIKPSLFSVMQEIAGVIDGKKAGVQTFPPKQDLQLPETIGNFEHHNSILFNAMEENTGKDWRLASPTGFEPVLPP